MLEKKKKDKQDVNLDPLPAHRKSAQTLSPHQLRTRCSYRSRLQIKEVRNLQSFCKHRLWRTSRTASYHLRNISHILSQKDAGKLFLAFVVCLSFPRLDYYNCVLSGCPNMSLKTRQLRVIQNPCVLTRSKRKDRTSPVLASLSWPTVLFRRELKICLLVIQ